MIPFPPDLSAVPAQAASTPLTNPGAAARQDGAGLDFAKVLGAGLLGAEPAGQTGASPAEPQPSTPLAIRLPSGTILPERGAPLPQPAALTVDAGGDSPLAEAPIPGTAAPEPAATPAPAPATLLPVVAGPIPADLADDTEPSPPEPDGADGAALPDPLVALLAAPLPLPAAIPVPATLAPANPPVPGSARLAARVMAHPAAPPAEPEVESMPEPRAMPEAADNAAPTPTPTMLLAEAATVSSSPTTTTTAPATQAAAAVVTPSPAAAVVDRGEPRPPAPQQDSTIAQVGELREALRAARPELTVRHTEFGFVSLRIEPTGAQDWRAVLASRDPGFVPAIQAALADRAIAATADTAGTGTGTGTGSGSGQNSNSDQRYGSSLGSGQGSSQPYLGQSQGRDQGGTSHAHQRQPHTTDTVAKQAGTADADRSTPRDRGVFA